VTPQTAFPDPVAVSLILRYGQSLISSNISELPEVLAAQSLTVVLLTGIETFRNLR
jgi:hypothetical protein